MNKVSVRCGKDQAAKFFYASRRMFTEVKAVRVLLYLMAIVPVTLSLIPIFNTNDNLSFVYTVLSFSITILSEVINQFLVNHKEKAILSYQLYESEITGSTFSKTEYDQELTNELEELAIRKGLPGMSKTEKYPVVKVPEEISDDYSYIYLLRKESSTVNFLLSRVYIFYWTILAFLIISFVSLSVWKRDDSVAFIRLIIGFYPLVIPIIRNCSGCKKCQDNCVKICADIDLFFSDGDASLERLARFYYYLQNIEFEMCVNRPAVYKITKVIYRKVTNVLSIGVTQRFLESVEELRVKSKGLAIAPRGKGLITKVDYDYNKIEEKRIKEQEKKALQKKVESKVNKTVKQMAEKNISPQNNRKVATKKTTTK